MLAESHLLRQRLDDLVRGLRFAHRIDHRLAQHHLGSLPHALADLGLLVERRLRQHHVALQRGLAHEQLAGNAKLQVREHLLHPIPVRIAHHRIARLHEQPLHGVGIAVDHGVGKA